MNVLDYRTVYVCVYVYEREVIEICISNCLLKS